MPDDLMDAYSAVRERLNAPGGWPSPIPCMHVREIRDLCLHRPLLDKLKSLVGSELAMNLNLPPVVNGYYAAVWIALDDIHPDSGPFQFVPGSHRWPGDVLVWHSRLVHRGSEPRRPGLPRTSPITHYTAIEKGEQYLPPVRKHGGGCRKLDG